MMSQRPLLGRRNPSYSLPVSGGFAASPIPAYNAGEDEA